MKRLILYVLISIIFIACNRDDTPKGIIKRNEMVSVMADMHMVDAYAKFIAYSDSLKQVSSAYYKAVYKKHGITARQFDQSLKYYSKQPQVLDSMYSQVLANLDRQEKEQQKALKKKRNIE